MPEKECNSTLREHLRVLGQHLISLSNDLDGSKLLGNTDLNSQVGTLNSSNFSDLPRLRAIARDEYRTREERIKHFGEMLFGEPAWDILLDLFVARIDGKRISVTSACSASQCPGTTALRWISVLESEGFVIRIEDTTDKRRTWVVISDKGMRSMERYLRSRTNTNFVKRILADLTKI